MSYTQDTMIGEIQAIFGDTSSAFSSSLGVSIKNGLNYLWDAHDWTFKHKAGSFNTVANTESYTLSSSSTDIRSAEDLEVVYDFTNGGMIKKVDLSEIKKLYPKADQTGMPTVYAPWGSKTIYLSPIPDGIYTIKYLYTSKATPPATGSSDFESYCGLPDYMHPVLFEIVMGHAMRYIDDSRYNSQQELIEKVILPRAIQADMQHIENNARFKYWQEVLSPNTVTQTDYLRSIFWGADGY